MKIDIAQRQQLLSQYKNGSSTVELALEFGISRSSVYNYLRLDREHESSNHQMKISFRQITSMKAELFRLRQENQILKTCGCTVNAPLSDKLKAIDHLAEDYSIHVLCRTLNVLRSTYYHHHFRSPEKKIVDTEDALLRPLVKQIFDDSKERFGTRKLKAALEVQGYCLSLKRLRRYMNELGLVCKQKRLKYFSSSNRKYMYHGNRLKRQFLQTAPNHVWVSDITYVRVSSAFYAICVVIDLFSRKVLAYRIASSNDIELVISTFDAAFFSREQPENLLFHSDQGVQYTSYLFQTHLRELGVRQSYSYPGMPYDNAVAESFFAAMKIEELSHHFYNELAELKRDVDEYIAFFNEKRLHGKLNYKTPNQIEDMFRNGELDLPCPKSEDGKGIRTNGRDASLSQTDL